MHRAEKIQALFARFGESVPVRKRIKILGLIPSTRSLGFLWITKKQNLWGVLLGDKETSHNLLDGPIYGADFRRDNGERFVEHGLLGSTGAWKSAINLHPVRNEVEAVEVFERVASKVDLAYDFHFPQVH